MDFSITKVNVRIQENNGMKALVDIEIGGMFKVSEIRIVELPSGRLSVQMPSKRNPITGKFREVCNPMNAQARSIIEEAVFAEYEKVAYFKSLLEGNKTKVQQAQ
jgi:DNA-binding cell septation regulator SpoVG